MDRHNMLKKLALALVPGIIPLVLLAANAGRPSRAPALRPAFDRPAPQRPAVVRASYTEWRRLVANR